MNCTSCGHPYEGYPTCNYCANLFPDEVRATHKTYRSRKKAECNYDHFSPEIVKQRTDAIANSRYNCVECGAKDVGPEHTHELDCSKYLADHLSYIAGIHEMQMGKVVHNIVDEPGQVIYYDPSGKRPDPMTPAHKAQAMHIVDARARAQYKMEQDRMDEEELNILPRAMRTTGLAIMMVAVWYWYFLMPVTVHETVRVENTSTDTIRYIADPTGGYLLRNGDIYISTGTGDGDWMNTRTGTGIYD